jgi:hypothetical protein
MKLNSSTLPFSLAILAAALSTTQPADASSSDSGTLTTGSFQSCHNISSFGFDYGYLSGVTGSYSPTGLTGGKTVDNLIDDVGMGGVCSERLSSFSASGFSSNPGTVGLSP